MPEPAPAPAPEPEPELSKSAMRAARETQYQQAYCRGMQGALGHPFAWPGGIDVQGSLNMALNAHARDKDGKPLRGDQLLHWIEDAAHDFGSWLRKNTDQARYYSHGHPKHFAKFLNEDAERLAAENDRAHVPFPQRNGAHSLF